MDLPEVIKKFRGDELKDTIVVWGDYGNNCRPYIHTFQPETNWILALKKNPSPDASGYIITICGEYYLPVVNGIVTGCVISKDQNAEKKEFELAEIEKIITNPELYPIEDKPTVIKPENDYLPLANGNYWKMSHGEKWIIDGTKVVDGREFFILKDDEHEFLYHKEGGKIWVKEFDDPPGVKFDLDANVNDTWKYNKWNIILISKTDSVTIHNHLICNCYHFYLDIPLMTDDEHSIWLATGIGFVKEECPEWAFPVIMLDEAKINGKEINLTKE